MRGGSPGVIPMATTLFAGPRRPVEAARESLGPTAMDGLSWRPSRFRRRRSDAGNAACRVPRRVLSVAAGDGSLAGVASRAVGCRSGGGADPPGWRRDGFLVALVGAGSSRCPVSGEDADGSL